MFVTSLPGLRARLCWLCKLPSKSGALFFFSFFCYPNWTCQLACKSMHKNSANKETNCIFIWRLLPAVTAQNKSTHNWIPCKQLTHSLSPAVESLFSEISRSCLSCRKHLIWMYHVAAVLYAESDLRLTHILSLLTFSQRLPNICSLSETRLIQLRRHWVASERISPSGGWLSGWVWADSCPGDGRTERWSWRKDQWYLGNLSPSAWHLGRGAALFSKWN